MNRDDFIMWLQGFAELSDKPPTPEQWQSIKEHLATCFNKVTPPLSTSELMDKINDSLQRKIKSGEIKPLTYSLPKILPNGPFLGLTC